MPIFNKYQKALKKMKIAVAKGSAHKQIYKSKLESFAAGITRCGDSVQWNDDPKQNQCDAAVIYGSYKAYRGSGHHKIKTSIAKSFDNFVQLETPVIGRSAKSIDHDYFRVGVNGFLWDEGKWGHEYIDHDRYKTVWKNLGYDIDQQWQTQGEHILILLQNPGDASLRGTDIFDWCYGAIDQIKKHTDRPIVVRPHPLPRKGFTAFANTIAMYDNVTMVENVLPNNLRPLELDFKNCYCAVSFASGSAVDAVLAGVPSLTNDPGNMAWEVSTHDFKDIENRYLGDRVAWMQKVAMCQWSVKEFESGSCWQHVKKSIT